MHAKPVDVLIDNIKAIPPIDEMHP